MPSLPPSTPHSRVPSGAGHRRIDSRSPKKPTRQQPEPDVHYTFLVRLPFPRGDFVDPPQVNWDASKDQALWEVISRSSNTSDLDWQELASTFDVPHEFLLRQAAWLYERHLSHVRAQMRRVVPLAASSPAQGGSVSGAVQGGVPMTRMGSGGASGSRAPSSLSVRSQKEAPRIRTSIGEGAAAGAPRPSQLSRTPSTATVTQSRHTRGQDASISRVPPSPRTAIQRSFRSSLSRAPPDTSAQGEASKQPERAAPRSPAASSPASSESESTSSEEEDVGAAPAGTRKSQVLRRGPAWLKHQKNTLSTLEDASTEGDEDGDDDDSNSNNNSLPFAAAAAARPKSTATASKKPEYTHAQGQDPTTSRPSTSRRHPSDQAPPPSQHSKSKDIPSSLADALSDPATSNSSASSLPAQRDGPSSATAAGKRPAHRPSRNRPPGPLSPNRRAELARGEAAGSEGTPSMGSSFSDLDDASVSQSALEEALLSKMQHGAAASRVSAFGQALRSKYL